MTEPIEKSLKRIKKADVVVIIPSYNNASTIGFVIHQVAQGLKEFFPKQKCVIANMDGGSTDGCLEVASAIQTPVDKIVGVYEPYNNIPGKGSAIRAGMEVADKLGAKAAAMVDSDLRSITPEWINLLLKPVLNDRKDYVTPHYLRYKYDGTITNFVAYPTAQALYGKRIRQPIGGDFGFSRRYLKKVLAHKLWGEPELPKFGIDIFMTSVALGERMNVCEAVLGQKIHDVKDPLANLLPMFRQVVGSLFKSMEYYKPVWKKVKGSESVPRVRGNVRFSNPEPFAVNSQGMVKTFIEGRKKHKKTLASALNKDTHRKIRAIPEVAEEFSFESDLWARAFLEMTAAYFKTKDREELLDALCTLWLGRVAYFTIESKDMSNREAEHVVEEQALIFEENKQVLLDTLK